MRYLLSLILLISVFKIDAQSLQNKLDSLTKAYEDKGYPGVILLAKADSIIYEKAYGYADVEKKIKNTVNTEFKTESLAKMFTSVSIMQLVEQGKLKTSQTIAELLPELKIANADKITVHQLLTHTSGLTTPWDDPKWNWKKRYTKEELMDFIARVPTAYPTPGGKFYYSNSGYIILGWIIEKVSGIPYNQYIQENIFRTAGMVATRELNDTIMPEKTGAQPYFIENAKYVSANEYIGPQAFSCGSWVSTVSDIYKFMVALEQKKYFKASTFKIMETANGTAPQSDHYNYYAYGLSESVNTPLEGIRLYGHIGGGLGFSIATFFDPGTKYIIVSFTNIRQNSYPIVINYMNALLGRDVFPVKKLLQ